MRESPTEIIAAEAFVFRSRPICWKRSTGGFVDSHCGFWHITPIYGGLTRPESYELWFGAETRRRVGSGQTQRECKATAEDTALHAHGTPCEIHSLGPVVPLPIPLHLPGGEDCTGPTVKAAVLAAYRRQGGVALDLALNIYGESA